MSSVTREVTIDLSTEELVQAFLGLNSIQQARFFDQVANDANEEWGAFKAEGQWCHVGRDLVEHGGSGQGIEMIKSLHMFIERAKTAPPRPKVLWKTHEDQRTKGYQP